MEKIHLLVFAVIILCVWFARGIYDTPQSAKHQSENTCDVIGNTLYVSCNLRKSGDEASMILSDALFHNVKVLDVRASASVSRVHLWVSDSVFAKFYRRQIAIRNNPDLPVYCGPQSGGMVIAGEMSEKAREAEARRFQVQFEKYLADWAASSAMPTLQDGNLAPLVSDGSIYSATDDMKRQTFNVAE